MKMTQFYMTRPGELPATLPAGAQVTFIDGDRATAVREASFDGELYRSDWQFLDGKVVHDGGYFASSIDWATVPRAPVQPFLPARGQRVRILELCDLGYDQQCQVGQVLVVLSATRMPGGAPYVQVEYEDGPAFGYAVCRVAPVEEAQFSARHCDLCTDRAVANHCLCERHKREHEQICPPKTSLCACGQLARYSGQCSDCRSDTEHGRTSLPQLSEPGALAARRMRSAKAQIERPIRTGKMGDRDRHGQKLSLKGWETDDD
jgi:hypothetical protein